MISYELDVPPQGTKVVARGQKRPSGVTTGGSRPCGMEGCACVRIGVRWKNKVLTYPCLGGMRQRDDGSLEIV